MKTKPILRLTLLLLAVVLGHEAQAFYNPSTGRWLNRDPIEEWGGLNPYACVINNPLSYVDTDGMQMFPPILIEAPPVLIPRPIFEPIVPRPGIPPSWLPQPAPAPIPVPPGGTMPPLYPPVPIIPPQPGAPNPTPDPSPTPSPQPQPNLGRNAPPGTATQDCGEWLCRLGRNWEATAQLASAAEKAKGSGYGYGVSVLLFSKLPPTASCAPKLILEAMFPVRKTGARGNHYTVIFVEPLSDPEADRFNRAIGRTPPPPSPPPPRRPYPPGTIIAVFPTY